MTDEEVSAVATMIAATIKGAVARGEVSADRVPAVLEEAFRRCGATDDQVARLKPVFDQIVPGLEKGLT